VARGPAARVIAALLASAALACGGPGTPRLTFSSSALGAEGEIVSRQLDRFAALHPEARVEIRVTPDAADQRHQLYVQWLNARSDEPDVLQLDIIWTAEFAAAGWLLPLDRFAPNTSDFFPAAVTADTWQDTLYAVPWFVDAGLLYWRTDLFDAPPASLAALRDEAVSAVARGETEYGLVWQGARYEGLVTVFLEHLGAFGGSILDAGGRVAVDSPEAVAALTWMRDAVRDPRFVPDLVLGWQEEQARFAFQNGQAAFMRNWPYAWTLLQGEDSRVAGRVGVAPFPAAAGGRPTAALGGAQLAINAHTAEPGLAWALVEFLTAPEQMLERAMVAGQLPARASLYDDPALAEALPLPLADVRQAIEAAVPRPVTPVYSELSDILQVRLHEALTGQAEPADALTEAAAEMRALLARTGLATPTEAGP